MHGSKSIDLLQMAETQEDIIVAGGSLLLFAEVTRSSFCPGSSCWEGLNLKGSLSSTALHLCCSGPFLLLLRLFF